MRWESADDRGGPGIHVTAVLEPAVTTITCGATGTRGHFSRGYVVSATLFAHQWGAASL